MRVIMRRESGKTTGQLLKRQKMDSMKCSKVSSIHLDPSSSLKK